MIQLTKEKPNKISYETLKNNKTLSEFVEKEKEVESTELKIKLQ